MLKMVPLHQESWTIIKKQILKLCTINQFNLLNCDKIKSISKINKTEKYSLKL